MKRYLWISVDKHGTNLQSDEPSSTSDDKEVYDEDMQEVNDRFKGPYICIDLWLNQVVRIQRK
jgi:hypothetical protein